MKLRDKTLLILGAAILVLGILLYYFTQHVFLHSYDQLDSERAYRRLNDIESHIDGSTKRVERICKDYANLLESLPQEERKAYLLDKGGNILKDSLDFVLTLDAEGQSSFSRLASRDGHSVAKSELAPYAERFISDNQYEGERALSGLISLDGAPYLSCMIPLRVADQEGEHTVLMAGERLDAAFMETIGVIEDRKRKVDVLDLSRDPGRFEGELDSHGGVWISEIDSSTIAASKFVRDIFGQRAFLYRAYMPRESLMQGRAVLGYFIFFLVLSGVLLGVVVFLQLERNFFAPLIALGNRLNKIGADGDLSERVGYSGHDEIHGLTKDIDNMLLALESSAHELSGSERRFKELFNNINSGVEIYSIEGHSGRLVLEDINSSALRNSGFREEDVVGRELLEIYPSLRGSELYMAILEVRDGRASVQLDPALYEGEHLSGWREYQAYKLPSNKLVVLHDDVSARMEVREALNQKQLELNQSQKMDAIGRLAGGIAHDFNNILTVVNGVSEILLLSMDKDDPIRSDLEEINAAGQRAAELTSQLLAFSRRQIMKTRVLNMDDVIGNIKKMLKRLIGESIELKIIQSSEPALILADSGQMEQVLVNLALNSRDAMPDGGYLEVETRIENLKAGYIARHVTMEAVKPVSGEYVVVRITDTGSGMDEETLQRICDPFFTTKAEGKGTGLGLSTTYGIIRQTNGFMWFESEVGRGTVCTIALPRTEKEVPSDKSEPVLDELPRCDETVLLAEDEDELRNVIKRFLEHLGCKVLVASTAEEALDIENDYEGDIDLMISDIIMPGMNGTDLWDRISSRRKDIKAVFITGYANEEAVKQGVSKGYNILTKPFNMIRLVKEIRKTLDDGDKSNVES